MANIGTDIQQAIHFLEQGQLVGMPTETVYGLAANGLNEKAVLSIFKAKNRPQFDPLILHVDSIGKLSNLVKGIPDKAVLLAEKFWPGPLTLLLEKTDLVPDIVTSGLHRVAVRVPSHPMARALLAELDFPLAAPSANPFGYISPTRAEHVQKQLGEVIPYILDGGQCEVGLESTIVGFEGDNPVIYRLGGIEPEAIEQLVGKVKLGLHQGSNPSAPGMTDSHYSPGKPLFLGNISTLLGESTKLNYSAPAILLFEKKDVSDFSHQKTFYLSETGNIDEAAQNLFSILRKLDESEADVILAEQVPNVGLGKAINDRLKRASVEKIENPKIDKK